VSQTILIRCRASHRVGFGHLSRSRVLAKELLNKGYRTILIGPNRELMNDEDHSIFTEWITREEWKSAQSEAEFHIGTAQHYEAKHIIIDDYRSDYEHQYLLRSAGLTILQQYDASKTQKFAAQFVINASPYEKESFYTNSLALHKIKMLLGPKYAILRPAFLDIDLNTVEKKNRVLVTFGGGDDRGAMLYTLDELKGNLPQDWSLVLMIGEHNPNIEHIKRWINEHPSEKIELKINPSNVPQLISGCTLAILAGGTTISEAAFLGVPSILIPIAENQYKQCEGWHALGAMHYLSPYNKLSEGSLRETLINLINDRDQIRKMREACTQSVDGLGTKRIIRSLLG